MGVDNGGNYRTLKKTKKKVNTCTSVISNRSSVFLARTKVISTAISTRTK
jgi:hypothetical protein